MEPEFITYQKFDDIALANELAETLEKHHIKYLMKEEAMTFDPAYAFPLPKDYAIKIRSIDFEHVNQILIKDESKYVDKIDRDYYLFAFSDDELMDVITKADEWSAFDIVLARKILAERGKDLSDNDIATINKERIGELKVPDKPQTLWIIIGYIFAFVGGILGIFIGWYLSTGKKTLPDGERVYNYSERDRMHGKIIFYISIVAFVVVLLYKSGVIFPER